MPSLWPRIRRQRKPDVRSPRPLPRAVPAGRPARVNPSPTAPRRSGCVPCVVDKVSETGTCHKCAGDEKVVLNSKGHGTICQKCDAGMQVNPENKTQCVCGAGLYDRRAGLVICVENEWNLAKDEACVQPPARSRRRPVRYACGPGWGAHHEALEPAGR